MIVTPFLQDVNIGAAGTLRTMIQRHTRTNAVVELLTTPPALKAGGEFRRKYALLDGLAQSGARVFLNGRLHAKAFCFNSEDTVMVTILGSANLTSMGLNEHLEMALFSARPPVYHSVMANVRLFLRHDDTADFTLWKARNASTIATLLRGMA